MAGEDGLVLLRGQWVEVDRQKLREALDHWQKVEGRPRRRDFVHRRHAPAGGRPGPGRRRRRGRRAQWSFVHAGKWLGEVLADLRSPENLAQIQLGDELQGTLRPYQETGLNWLWFLSNLGLGACLADDMGLGKTIQVLALLAALKKRAGGKPRCWSCRLALGELEVGDGPLHPDAAGRVHPSVGNPERGTGPDRRQPRRGAEGTDLVLTTYGMLLRQPWLLEVAGGWWCSTRPRPSRIRRPGRPRPSSG